MRGDAGTREGRCHTFDAKTRLQASFVENCTAEYGKIRITLVPLPLQNALTPSSLQQQATAEMISQPCDTLQTPSGSDEVPRTQQGAQGWAKGA